MNSAQRIRALLNGEEIDRVPITGWRHFPLVDKDPKAFAEKTIEFTGLNQWDVIKLMSHGLYLSEAHGVEISYSNDALTANGNVLKPYVASPSDLGKIRPVPASNKALSRELELTERVAGHYNGENVVLPTLFTPLSWFKQFITGSDLTLQDLLGSHAKALHSALEAINATSFAFIDAAIEKGADGFFIAEQFALKDQLSDELYLEFCEPYTKALLGYIKGRTWFNILHLHGAKGVRVAQAQGYDVESLNWEFKLPGSTDDSEVSLAEAKALTDKVLIGGLELSLPYKKIEEADEFREFLRERLSKLLDEAKGQKFIFGPGCGWDLNIDEGLYPLISESVSELATI